MSRFRHHHSTTTRRGIAPLLAFGLAIAMLTGACTSKSGSGTAGKAKQTTIPQPVVENLNVAPSSARVDIRMPSFSHPTSITNPLFPVSKQGSILFLGHVDGKPFRTEVTLLPETRIIEWQGRRIETLVIQYNAYLTGRIEEIAYDYYAQADDASVWYFGEDVFDFKDGRTFGTQGTWLAGRDGPAAMIMPGHPKVGDVFRTENIPGVVFEEVTVTSMDETLDGPLGPIRGGIIAAELHVDGTTEKKIFAPGYGEFFTSGGGDVEALALAVPVNALASPLPSELITLRSGAYGVFDAAGSKNWAAASAALKGMNTAWKSYSSGEVLKLIKPALSGALTQLTAAVGSRKPVEARRAAIETARLSLDLQLRYRPSVEVNLARFDLWAAELQVDAAAGDKGAVNGDFFALDYVRDRIHRMVEPVDLARIDIQLDEIQSAMHDDDVAAASKAAGQIRSVMKRLLIK